MPDYRFNRLILVSESQRAQANAAARQLDPDPNCGDTFIVPCSADGAFPASHWVTQVQLTADGLAKVEQLAAAFPGAVLADGEATGLRAFLAAQGLRVAEDLG